MKPYQFNKKGFPGLGSLSPKAKKEKADFEKKQLELKFEELKKAAEVSGVIDSVLKWFKEPPKFIPMGPSPLPPETTVVELTDSPKIKVDYSDLEFKALEKTYDEMKKMALEINGVIIKPTQKNPCGEVVLSKPQVTVLPAPNEEKQVPTKKNGKSKTGKKEKAPAIYQWAFTSAQEVEGMRAKYTTLLRQDQSLTCNCPGWIFKKKGETERACKHTRLVADEAKSIFKKWKKGEALPTMEDAPISNSEFVPGSTHKTGSSIGNKRAMDLNF